MSAGSRLFPPVDRHLGNRVASWSNNVPFREATVAVIIVFDYPFLRRVHLMSPLLAVSPCLPPVLRSSEQRQGTEGLGIVVLVVLGYLVPVDLIKGTLEKVSSE